MAHPQRSVSLKHLNPSYAVGDGSRKFLILDCPHCRNHSIAVQVAGEGEFVWESEGDTFENVTLTPSIAAKSVQPVINNSDVRHIQRQFIHGNIGQCAFHFFVRNGRCIFA